MTITNLNCDSFDEALPDYLEGTLDETHRVAAEQHLRECLRCAGLVKDLERISREAATLPDLVPSRDLWAGIEARIAAPVIPFAPPAKSRRFAPWMAVAAAALIVSTAAITYELTARSLGNPTPARVASVTSPTPTTAAPSQQAEPVGSTAPAPLSGESANATRKSLGNASKVSRREITGAKTTSGTPAVQLARNSGPRGSVGSEAVYGKEIDMLQKIVNDRRTQLDSSTVAIIEKNLGIIDAAIAHCRAALVKDPASLLLSQQLTRALDKKVELLRTAALLPSST